jgi:ankyrin repeat protein
MSEDKIVNNDILVDFDEILDACARKIKNENGKEDSAESYKIFLKYFNPSNPILDINQPIVGQGKWTPLAFATYFGKNDEVACLLNLGAKPDVELDRKMTVLHMAASEGKEALCNYFLKKNCNIDAQCERGTTALMRASEGGHFDIVRVLLPYNPNIMLTDNEKKSCIDYCRDADCYDIIRYINNYHLNATLPKKSEGEYNAKKVTKI